jgi:hypothetical protein
VKASRAWITAVATLVACLTIGLSTAAAAQADIGIEGPSFAPSSQAMSGSKPESKLWFNDGQWWASMYEPAAGGFRIFRLSRATESWVSTGTPIDDRVDSRADTLWDGASGKLYVASHRFTETNGAAGSPSRLYRYSYSGGTYSLDAGYPVDINGNGSETLVIDKDSTGTLWATWTRSSQVFVSHTVGGDDASWATPFVIPGRGTTLSSDDISSLIHFGGNRIGVMWSNEDDNNVYFSVHVDGAAPTAWATEDGPTGFHSDDHINLKADSAGRVYAALKTSDTAQSQEPLILLAVRGANGWQTHTFGTRGDDHTRPIVELDEQHGMLYLFATCGGTGGQICVKSTSMSNPSFTPGDGTQVIADTSSSNLNDASSTKQNLDASTGLVVLASNKSTMRYWHADLSLGAGPPPPLGAGFDIDATVGPTPLDVRFADASSGAPTSWSWSFGDGTGSSARNPTHRYAAPGTYTVTLRVGTASQTATATRTITVGTLASPPVGGVLGTTASVSRHLTLRARSLRRQRVLLWGVLEPSARTTVTLQRRDRRGRWHSVRRTTTRPRSAKAASYTITVRRLTVRSVYRVVVTTAADGRRTSAVLRLAARRAGR